MRFGTVHTPEFYPVVLDDQGEAYDLRCLGYPSLLALVQGGAEALAAVDRAYEAGTLAPVTLSATENLAAPIPVPPRNVFCIGQNYARHVMEARRANKVLPTAPNFFSKPWTSLVGPRATVGLPEPEVTSQIDWEGEIAVVIGARGKNISESDAGRYIFGYTLANDVSARDLQHAAGDKAQWLKGKSLDGFCPMGPYIRRVDPDYVWGDLTFEVRLNDAVVQAGSLGKTIYSVEEIVSYLSLGMELLPGDIILTGTPEGVGFWRDPPRFLVPGDVVSVSSAGVGELNTSFAGPGARQMTRSELPMTTTGRTE